MQEAYEKMGLTALANDTSKKLLMRIKDKTLHQLKNQTSQT